MPKTRPGRLAVTLIASFGGLLVLLQVLVATGQEGGETLLDNLLLSVPATLAAGCAVTTLFVGCWAIFRRRDRGAIVIVATVTGLLVSLFLLGEATSPH